MSNMQNNPTDEAVARRLGQMELQRIRMAWMLDQQQFTINALNQALASKDVLIAAKDAEINRLRVEAAEPGLPLEHVNGNASEVKH